MTTEDLPLTFLLGGAFEPRQVLADRRSNDLGPVRRVAVMPGESIDAREHGLVNSDRNSLHIENNGNPIRRCQLHWHTIA